MGSIPGLGRTPGGGNGNPLKYLAWEISWTEEPGVLQSMGSQRVRHNPATEQQKARALSGIVFNFDCTLPLKFRAHSDKLKSPWGEIGFLGF